MFKLKALSADAIPKAQAKADRYRLLNDPRDAESICRDILRTDPENQNALRTIILALTDQFGKAMRVNIGHVEEMLPRVTDEYARCYYTGVTYERWAKAQFGEETPGYVVYDWLVQAMGWFEKAEALSPPGVEDAVLRYNACARIIKRNDQLRPRPEDETADACWQDDVPMR